MCLMMTGRRCKNSITNGWNRRNRHLKAITGSRKRVGRSRANGYIVKNNEGVWTSTKLFYFVGSLSLLSIITIAMEIVFYVYFKWIQ